ncbi:MAG: hypothetical protein COA79_08235 [Planctomycetota bacterium]|nr:MAG: hypothetical protein COA79_08235 [Planctomycetota bacterium]
MNILLIVDEEAFPDYVNLLLAPKNYFIVFHDPDLALQHYDQKPIYDVIIIDSLRPVAQIDQFILKICEIKSSQNIIVSSDTVCDQKLLQINKHNSSIKSLEKPFSLSEIDALIESLNEKEMLLNILISNYKITNIAEILERSYLKNKQMG